MMVSCQTGVIMVPVVTRAPNITNISCWKIAPKPLLYIDIWWNYSRLNRANLWWPNSLIHICITMSWCYSQPSVWLPLDLNVKNVNQLTKSASSLISSNVQLAWHYWGLSWKLILWQSDITKPMNNRSESIANGNQMATFWTAFHNTQMDDFHFLSVWNGNRSCCS